MIRRKSTGLDRRGFLSLTAGAVLESTAGWAGTAGSGSQIESAETIPLRAEGLDPLTLVRVRTKNGIEGVGQAESPSLVIDACLKARGGVDVVQPSTVRSGGISEIVKVTEFAYRRGRLCIPHCWCHMFGVAVALHIAAVVPNMRYFEFPTAFPSPALLTGLLVPQMKVGPDGMIEVPKRPGLGFTLNEEIVRKYRVPLS